jgi:NADPH-dependent 2,4-dienoyl-CoA reductase/sulfur reductase-like enzyme
MARDAGSVVVVGAGLAGFTAAAQLRALGHESAITLVDAEPGSYDRPPLSKSLFEEGFSLDRLAFASDEDLAAKRIDTRFGDPAVSIDPEAGRVTLESGEVLPADTVLITTGGRARRLPIPGSELPGVGVLRTFADAAELRDSVTAGTRVAVVGAGLIGAELASALLERGAEVTLVDPVETPLVPAVGELLAARLHAMHEPRGVRVVTGLTAGFAEADGALEVSVVEGPTIPVDRIVVGVGLVPNVELAQQAGLRVDDGIVVDEGFRTSAENVFAAGDVARTCGADGELRRREEHWEAAQLSGKEAAHAILGLEAPARGASWFWSDRHGCHLEATGRLSGPGEIVVREGGEHPAVFLVEDGLLRGAGAIDDAQTVRAARRLIDQRIPVSTAELADPAVPLRSLLKARR